MKLLGQIAKQTSTIIVATLQQPGYDVFRRLDRVLLLSAGKVAYFGEGGAACLGYFRERLGLKCSLAENPADFVLKEINADFVPRAKVVSIREQWEKGR